MDTQLRMDVIERQLPTSRPLVKLDVVMHLLQRNEDDCKYLYEAGLLRWAFDLSSPGSRRKEVRIWRGSVIEYQAGDHRVILNAHQTESADEARKILAACLPPGLGPVALSKLVPLWAASSTHLHDLLKESLLRPLAGQQLKQTETPMLDRASVIGFLQSRRIA